MHKSNDKVLNYLNSTQQTDGLVHRSVKNLIGGAAIGLHGIVCNPNVVSPDYAIDTHIGKSATGHAGYLISPSILDLLGTSRRLSIEAPAGAGKSYFTMRTLAPALNAAGYMVLFAAPFVSQIAGESEKQKSNPFPAGTLIYDSAATQEKGAAKYQSVLCTYDKTGLAHGQLFTKEMLSDYPQGIILIIDESQFLTLSQSYRAAALREIERLVGISQRVIFVSATPNRALEQIMKFKPIVIRRKVQPTFNISIQKSKQTGLAIIDFCTRNKARGVLSFVYVNNYATIHKAAAVLRSQGLNVEIHTGNKLRIDTPEGAYFAANERFMPETNVVLCTEVLLQAVSVLDERPIEQMYCLDRTPDKDGGRLYQFANRLRHYIENALPINVTVLASPNSSIFENEKPAKPLIAFAKATIKSWNEGKADAMQMSRLSEKVRKEVKAAIETAEISPGFSFPISHKIKIDKKGFISIFAAVADAQNNRFNKVQLADFINDFKQYSGAAVVNVSEIDTAFESDFSADYAAATVEFSAEKTEAMQSIAAAAVANFKGLASWYVAKAKDVHTVASLGRLGHISADKPGGELWEPTINIHSRLIAQTLDGFFDLYAKTGSEAAALAGLEREIAAEKIPLSKMKAIKQASSYAEAVVILRVFPDFDEVSKAIHTKKINNLRHIQNALSKIRDAVRTIAASETTGEAAAAIGKLLSRAKEAENKAANDKKNAKHWKQQAAKLRAQAAEISAPTVLFSQSELIERIKEVSPKAANYKNVDFPLLFRVFSNQGQGERLRKIAISENFDYSIEYFASVAQTTEAAICTNVANRLVRPADIAAREYAYNHKNTGTLESEALSYVTDILRTDTIAAAEILTPQTETATEAQNKPTNEQINSTYPTPLKKGTDTTGEGKTLLVAIPLHAQQLANLPASPAPF